MTVRFAGQDGDIERLARQAAPEVDLVVAAGGDGTVDAALNGLAATARPLAILPLGTVNLVARELRLPRRPDRLAEIIAAGPVRSVWPARVEDRLFLTVASAGFDAEIVAAIRPALKRAVGRLAFAWAAVAALLRYRCREIALHSDSVEHRAAAVIAAKGRFYAGPFVAARQASLAAPSLELILLHGKGRLAVLRYACGLLLGSLDRMSDVSVLRARTVRLLGSGPVQADGEIVAELPVTISLAERPIALVGP